MRGKVALSGLEGAGIGAAGGAALGAAGGAIGSAIAPVATSATQTATQAPSIGQAILNGLSKTAIGVASQASGDIAKNAMDASNNQTPFQAATPMALKSSVPTNAFANQLGQIAQSGQAQAAQAPKIQGFDMSNPNTNGQELGSAIGNILTNKISVDAAPTIQTDTEGTSFNGQSDQPINSTLTPNTAGSDERLKTNIKDYSIDNKPQAKELAAILATLAELNERIKAIEGK